eukprot:scaffold48082_cov19-Prasinocladus_malaysianus.AAC.2
MTRANDSEISDEYNAGELAAPGVGYSNGTARRSHCNSSNDYKQSQLCCLEQRTNSQLNLKQMIFSSLASNYY